MMKKFGNPLFLLTFLGSIPAVQAAPADQVTVGKASFYAERFHGRRTASGERYNMNDLTAATAHSRYPFGTVLRVTNLHNSRTVQVRVNDRGPLPHGRVLDLSKRAATDLGFLRSGTARVKIEVVEWGGARAS